MTMKRLMTAVMMVGLCAGVAQAQTKAAAPKKAVAMSSSAADELKKLENDWIAASVRTRSGWGFRRRLGRTELGRQGRGQGQGPGGRRRWARITSYEMGPMDVRFATSPPVVGSDTEKSTGARTPAHALDRCLP